MPELFLQRQKSWYVKSPLSAKLPLSSAGCWHRLLQLPLYFLRSLLVERDWTSQFLFVFLVPPPFLLQGFKDIWETSCAHSVVKVHPTCSSAPSNHWLASWTFFLRMASWLTASSCSCVMASSCFCLVKKKSKPQAVSDISTKSQPLGTYDKFKLNILPQRASLVVQWLRICLPMQGTRVRALVWEDPTCRGATKPVSHNYWACASGACAPQQERPR